MDEYKYLAIVEWSKNYIKDNQLKPDDRFLSENELCSIHNVSRQTVRQALKVLETENVIAAERLCVLQKSHPSEAQGRMWESYPHISAIISSPASSQE